jgi:hypothetical protein
VQPITFDARSRAIECAQTHDALVMRFDLYILKPVYPDRRLPMASRKKASRKKSKRKAKRPAKRRAKKKSKRKTRRKKR